LIGGGILLLASVIIVLLSIYSPASLADSMSPKISTKDIVKSAPRKSLQTWHEVLDIMLGFLLEKMTRVIATKPFDFNDAFVQVFNTKMEIEKFLEDKYGHSLFVHIYH
jgi:hypothetical protein